MGELWVSHSELVETIGEISTDLLCRVVGGVPVYIPHAPLKDSQVSVILGVEKMQRLCTAFGGIRIIVPNRRKGEPFKARIVRMLKSGKHPGEIAFEIGVTERYVRMVASDVKKNSTKQEQLRLW